MSCGLPAASFAAIKSALEMKYAVRPLCRLDDGFHPILPCAVKINSLDFREDVHDDRCAAHAKELVTGYEVFGCKAIERGAELAQRGVDRAGVFSRLV